MLETCQLALRYCFTDLNFKLGDIFQALCPTSRGRKKLPPTSESLSLSKLCNCVDSRGGVILLDGLYVVLQYLLIALLLLFDL